MAKELERQCEKALRPPSHGARLSRPLHPPRGALQRPYSPSRKRPSQPSYRDRKDGDRKKTLVLDAHEFIRRFLLHILPDGFMRIRHFGFLANRSKKHLLPRCRKLLDLDPALPHRPSESAKDLLLKITGFDLTRCPCCHNGTMIVVGDLPRISNSPQWDSS